MAPSSASPVVLAEAILCQPLVSQPCTSEQAQPRSAEQTRPWPRVAVPRLVSNQCLVLCATGSFRVVCYTAYCGNK